MVCACCDPCKQVCDLDWSGSQYVFGESPVRQVHFFHDLSQLVDVRQFSSSIQQLVPTSVPIDWRLDSMSRSARLSEAMNIFSLVDPFGLVGDIDGLEVVLQLLA